MFFILSKLFWLVASPGNAFLLLLIAGQILRLVKRRRVGLAASLAGLIGFVALGFLPVGALLLRPLENRFPPPPADMPQPTGIIVLGGSTDETISDARDQVTIVDAATRVTAAVALAQRYPNARLVFSGGSGALLLHPRTEAADTRSLWIAMGLRADRVTVEDQSHNTDENARFTKALIAPRPGEQWLLVTSAYHMPRAVALFRTVGFPVTPYPVDYHTSGRWTDLLPPREITLGLGRSELALREWIGLAVYRLTGRTETLFPGPDDRRDPRKG